MAITREEFKGTKIINEIQSSNIVKTEYDTETKKYELKEEIAKEFIKTK